jgi:hypothetical protein
VSSVYEILNLLFKYKPPFSIDQFFAPGVPDRKTIFLLDVISLIKQKHAVLNKRSSSVKPKSVTFKEEDEVDQAIRGGKSRGVGMDLYSTIDS